MEPIHAVILGVIQGLTEFLPVSSSGHLVIFQYFFGFESAMVSFDISVHIGTLLAVVIVFRAEILKIIISVFCLLKLSGNKERCFDYINKNSEIKLVLLIAAGSVPTGIIGLLFHKFVDKFFTSIFITGAMLIITGFLLWGTKYIKKNDKNIENFSIKGALFIGMVQGIAILPGISRSGSTIAAGLFLGLNREVAAKYSFLLSIPAIIGAEILSLKNFYGSPQVSFNITILGIVVSFIVGLYALKVLLYFVRQGDLYYFSFYCWFVGIAALLYGVIF